VVVAVVGLLLRKGKKEKKEPKKNKRGNYIYRILVCMLDSREDKNSVLGFILLSH
jgi:hypothetical protein